MNYYIQGDAAKADQIKAAFKKLGCDTGNLGFTSSQLYYTIEGRVELMCTKSLQNLIKTHPDYKELALPVEPKFKVGDWIVREEGFVYEPSLITEIRDYYICELLNGERVTYTLNDVHKNFHLWTLADAKDGDVLSIDFNGFQKIVIFKSLSNKGVEGYGITAFKDRVDFPTSYGKEYYSKTWTKTLTPATKEQRIRLFTELEKAGYKWDAEKKELRKIQHYDIANFRPFDKVLVRCGNDEEWMIEFYCKYDTLVHTSPHRDYPFMGIGDSYSQCIPFNDDTKHLLGTTDMCPEEYINW